MQALHNLYMLSNKTMESSTFDVASTTWMCESSVRVRPTCQHTTKKHPLQRYSLTYRDIHNKYMFLYVCVSLKYPTTKPTVMKIWLCNLLRAKCLFLRWRAVMFDLAHVITSLMWVTVQDYTPWAGDWSRLNNNCAGIPSFSISEETVHSFWYRSVQITNTHTHTAWLNIWNQLTVKFLPLQRCIPQTLHNQISLEIFINDVWLLLKCSLLCRWSEKTPTPSCGMRNFHPICIPTTSASFAKPDRWHLNINRLE